MLKQNNEITIRIKCDKKEFLSIIRNKGFKYLFSFSLDDSYFIKKDVILNENIREILSKAIIVRIIKKESVVYKNLTYKKKCFDESGNIISQTASTLKIIDEKEAFVFLEKLGYTRLMSIKEDDLLYTDGTVELAIKDIEEKDLLVEVETNDKLDTTNKLIAYIEKLELPIEENNYFVKKAEEYYRKNIYR